MAYKETVRFENTAAKMSNAASAIYYAVSDSIAADEGLSLRVVKRRDKHGLVETILFVEAAVSPHDHDVEFDPDQVAQYYASAMKMRRLEEEGQDAVEVFVEDVLSQLREDTDDDGEEDPEDREDNPAKPHRLHNIHPERGGETWQGYVGSTKHNPNRTTYAIYEIREDGPRGFRAKRTFLNPDYRHDTDESLGARTLPILSRLLDQMQADCEGVEGRMREDNPSHSGLPLGSIALGAALGAAAMHFTMKPKQ